MVLIGATPGVQAGNTAVRDADLAVDQPAYLDGNVAQKTVNGTTQYRVSGGPVEIRPRNIDSDVVDFGVSTDGASLQYDEEMDEYVFKAEASGTYDVYWATEETMTVNTTANATGNATNGTATNTTTTTRRVRYEAQIRVATGQVTPVRSDRLSALETRASKWKEFNATVQELRNREFLLRPDERTTGQTIQGMIKSYITTSSPVAALSGNATAVLLIMATTLGGALVFVAFFAYNAISIASLRGQLNRFRATEGEEGEVADRRAQLARDERVQTAAGTDLQDIPTIGDYWAGVLSDTHGPNLRTAWESILAERDQILIDYLTVMTQNGYAVVGEGDGVEVVADGEVADREVRAPHELASDELAALDDSSAIADFDMDSARIDWDGLPDDTVTLDLDQWVDEWQLDIDHDADLQSYGEMMVALCEAASDHEFTDADGSVRPDRAYMEAMLDGAYTAERYHLPAATMLRDLFEQALKHHSPTDRVQQTVSDIQNGRYSSGDD